MLRVDWPSRLPNRMVLDKDVIRVSGRDWNVDFTLDDMVPILQLEEHLRQHLEESHNWLVGGGAVTVNVGRRVLRPEDLVRIRQVVEDEFHLKIAKFWCEPEILERGIAEEAGVPISLTHPKRSSAPKVEATRQPTPLFVKNACRSGTSIRHNGDVVVLGDVNPGAQVTATGDIVILGTLRGIAHAGAGATDVTEAVIIALALKPLQLRIGQYIGTTPTDSGKYQVPEVPEIARVSGRSIVVAPFTGNFQRISVS
jgi:septum site-determining protein MinC